MKNQRKNHSILNLVQLSLALMLIVSMSENISANSTDTGNSLRRFVGPYTIEVLAQDIYHIEDANESNPAGMQLDKDGNYTGINNCSDMYFIVGKEKALLIDLSNALSNADKATEFLRSIVYERTGNKELYVTITHNHGDHLGMLPAFVNDSKAKFWLSEAEFKNVSNRFPAERTTYFAENASFDLGGFKVNTIEVPGHTAHSILFFLNDDNLVFSGDAIGSGTGVWLFNYDGFLSYIKGIENLIKYIENPANNIDIKKLVIHGGHNWQSGQIGKLTAQYIYDMRTLIEKISQGTAESNPMSPSRGFLDTNFKYGTATITWNKEAAAKYADSVKAESP